MNQNMEIVQEKGKYKIVKYYANTLYTNGDKENGNPYYGDIYLTKEDVLKAHPDAEILEGYGLIDTETNYHPDDADDWYDSVEEVIKYIEKQ